MTEKTIAIVGLGLIGGSLAGALMDFDGAHVLGVCLLYTSPSPRDTR